MLLKGTQSLRYRKALSKIIQRREKHLPILEKIVMKFFLHFIFQLGKIYILFDTWHIVSGLIFLWYIFLMHGTLSAVFPFFAFWGMTLCKQFFLSLTQENFSIAFSLIHEILSAIFLSYLLSSFEKMWKVFFKRIEVYIYSKSSDSFVNIWRIHYWPTCLCCCYLS